MYNIIVVGKAAPIVVSDGYIGISWFNCIQIIVSVLCAL